MEDILMEEVPMEEEVVTEDIASTDGVVSGALSGNEAASSEAGRVEAGWMIQSLCFGVGKGLDTASGSNKEKPKTPHSTPPIRTVLSETRLAAVAA